MRRLLLLAALASSAMAQQPFVRYESFDVAAFVDYGQLRYDKHENDPKRGGAGKKTGKGSAP